MKHVSINLASRPFYNTRLYLVAFSVSLALLVLVTGLNVYTYFVDQSVWTRFSEAQERMKAELRALDSQAAGHRRDLGRLDLEHVAGQSEFANDAILQRVFSWTLLFNRLEEVMPPTVKLRSIRPQVQDNGIHFRVAGTAKDPAAFADFEDSLLASPLFSEVYPGSERISSSGRGIDFNLDFRYLSDDIDGPTAEEDPAAGEGAVPPSSPPASPETTRAGGEPTSDRRPEAAGAS